MAQYCVLCGVLECGRAHMWRSESPEGAHDPAPHLYQPVEGEGNIAAWRMLIVQVFRIEPIRPYELRHETSQVPL